MIYSLLMLCWVAVGIYAVVEEEQKEKDDRKRKHNVKWDDQTDVFFFPILLD